MKLGEMGESLRSSHFVLEWGETLLEMLKLSALAQESSDYSNPGSDQTAAAWETLSRNTIEMMLVCIWS